MQFEIDSAGLKSELDRLAGYSDVPSPAVTRVVYSTADLARAPLRQATLCRGWS